MSTIKITAPEYCPFCGSPVVKQLKDGAHLYCSNKDCKERLLQQLNYFVTKQCMNIDGLSEKTLRKLQSAGLVKYWYDLYSLTFDQCVNAGLGNKTSLKIIDELAKSRTQVPAENVLMALGIPMIGKVAAQELLAEFGSIKEIENAANSVQVDHSKIVSHGEGYAIMSVIGDAAGQSLISYFKENKEELQYVYTYLTYTSVSTETVSVSNKLEGMTILATGTLQNFTRDGIKESVIANGGKYASGVNGKLSFMIVGSAGGSSKIDKANKLGIKMISEEEYLNLIK